MALSPYDQSVYDAGYKYIPQSQYLLNPYAIPQGTENEVPSGIPAVYQSTPMGANTMGGALQAGNINYGDFAKAGFDAYANRQPSPLVDDLYQSKLDKSFLGFPSYQQQELTGPDMGEYIGSDTDIPLELTRAGQIQKSLQGFGQGIQSLGQKIGGFGPISMVLGSMDKFDELPALDKQFIEQSMGYRGPTVFGENTTGGYVDPFGVNVRSAFGNYAEKVRDEFGSLGESLSGRLSDKYGATFNTETGMFESENEEAARKANQMTNLMRKKFVFRQQQIKQQEFDKKIAEQQAAAAAAEAQAQAARDNAGTQRRSDGSGGGNLTRSRDQGGLGLSASQAQSVSAANAAAGMGGWGLADGGRVPYMDGGITDMLEIYD